MATAVPSVSGVVHAVHFVSIFLRPFISPALPSVLTGGLPLHAEDSSVSVELSCICFTYSSKLLADRVGSLNTILNHTWPDCIPNLSRPALQHKLFPKAVGDFLDTGDQTTHHRNL